jgi:hypothetical protein
MNCWELLKCPPETYGECPAYPDKGLDCWKVTETKCDNGKHEKATIQEKINHCRQCDFYVKYANKF